MSRRAQRRAVRKREQRYLQLNGKYLADAREFLAKGDLVQASEKLWVACAEMVNAVAARRATELGSHGSLWDFVARLHRERPDWQLLHQFSYAGNLHTNFYEGWLSEDYVRIGLEVAEDFAKLRRLL